MEEFETTLNQQIKLATDLLRLGLPEDYLDKDKALLPIENAIKLIGGCSLQVKQDAETSGRVAQTLSSCGTAEIFSKLMGDLRRCMNKKTWPCIMALRTSCITLTDTFDSFCMDLCSAGFMVILKKELEVYSEVRLGQNMEEFLVVSALAILENCAEIPSLVEILWELKADQVLFPYMSSPLLQVCIPALVLLGLLSVNADKGIVCMDKETATVFSERVADAVKHTSLSTEIGYMRITAEGLVKGANGLALNVGNATNFLKSGFLTSFLTYFKGSHVDSELSLTIMKFLWTLATHSTIKKQLLVEPEIVQEINFLSDTIPAAKCALLKIKDWNPKEDAASTVDYLECAYHEGRYTDCISICDSVLLDSADTNCSKENIRRIKLVLGKSIYFMHKNSMKLSETPVNCAPFQRKERFKLLEKVIQTLGFLMDDKCLDKEGSRILDIAMVDYIRETNSLNSCQRCLLCREKNQLRSSHIIPHFILSGFAKGMSSTASKKVYFSFKGSSEPKSMTPRQMAWWMLCGSCEHLLSASGESPFATEFFHKIYKTTDPSMLSQEHRITYLKWLYHFAAGIAFRGLAVNSKGIAGFLNDNHVYQVFTACREVLLNPDEVFTKHPQIAIFTNPSSVYPESSQSVSTLNRLLNMPGFMYLVENDEKLHHFKIPRIANLFIAHFGVFNIVVPFVGGDFALPPDAGINAESGTLTIPPENLRLESLPPALWESLTLCAQKVEEVDIQITQKRLQESEVYDTTPTEALKKVYGLARAKQSDMELIEKVGFQPSSDPRFPKKFNFLPPNTCVRREADEASSLSLPLGHKLLLHQTSETGNQGITLFLCTDNSKLYVIRHKYMPGLHLDLGFFVSSDDLSPQELLPDKNPKVYAQHLLDDMKLSGSVQRAFSKFLKGLNLSVDNILDAHTRNKVLIAKCVPRCWFCADKCDICFSPAVNSLILYKQKIMYCDSICRAKIIRAPPIESALPKEFKITNELDGISAVKIPEGHTVLAHTTTECSIVKHESHLAYLTLFLCRADEVFDHRLYILCHIHSLAEQFSVGMFISSSDYTPLELLPGSNCSSSHSVYIDSLYSTGIVSMLLAQILSKHQVDAIEKVVVEGISNERCDRRCEIPCWYCKDKCATCFATISGGEKYCNDACRDKHKMPLRIFSSLPEKFLIERAFKESEQSIVTLPPGHRYLFHTTGSSHNTDGELVSEMTIILCVNDVATTLKGRFYVLFQEYKPQRNRLANVAFYISPDSFAVEGPLCENDLPGHIFIDNLKSPLYNIPSGIKEALRRRGLQDLSSVLHKSRCDIKCPKPCWFCRYRCLVCLQPAILTSKINGEDILHCSDSCLQVVFQNPGIVHLLPPDFEVVNSPGKKGSKVTLPEGHKVLLHTCRDYKRKDGRFGQYILLLCINKEKADANPYLLYHQFNSLRQLTFGFFVSYSNLESKEPLTPLNKEDQMKCLKFMQQLLVLEPIGKTMQDMLVQQGVSEFSPNTVCHIQDTTCVPPCWYCSVRCDS